MQSIAYSVRVEAVSGVKVCYVMFRYTAVLSPSVSEFSVPHEVMYMEMLRIV